MKKPFTWKRMAYMIFKFAYMRSSAKAKKVKLKGNIIDTHDPYGEKSMIKNKATEIKNNTQ